MDSASTSLLSRLESSDHCDDIHALVSAHLRPFSPFISGDPKPNNIKKKSPDDRGSSVRSLAKQFLPFVNRALSVLQKRLSKPPESQPQCVDGSGVQLFETYRLCLKCLECMSSQLDCKPHTLYAYRVWMIHCFEKWGRFEDAETEGFAVLECLKCINTGSSGSNAVKMENKYLPYLTTALDQEFKFMILEAVVTLVKCAGVRHTRKSEAYWRVLALVDEASPWFRALDAKSYEKLHRLLVTFLQKCFMSLMGDLQCFDRDLVLQYCLVTFQEYRISSMKDEMFKLARRACSSIFLRKDDSYALAIDVLECILDSVSHECKIEGTVEFFELVSYCATKCISVGANLCKAVAAFFNKMAAAFFKLDLTPSGMILRLYASGLYLNNCYAVTREFDSVCSRSLNKKSEVLVLLKNGDMFEQICMIDELGSYFHTCCEENSVSFSAGPSTTADEIHSSTKFNHVTSLFCSQRDGVGYMFCYLKALACLCQPLSELVNSERKQIIAEDEDVSFSNKLSVIQGVFHQFCDVYHRCKLEKVRDEFDVSRTLLTVAVAAYTLSWRTKLNMQRSVDFVRHIISSEWIQLQGLKFLSASLYSIGITLYKYKQAEETLETFRLFYMASRTCSSCIIKASVDGSKGLHSDLSESAVAEFINDACTKNAFVSAVMHQCGSCKWKEIIVDCLKSWLIAARFCKSLQDPFPLVKQWVKINCKLHKGCDMENDAPTIYCLLSSSVEISERLSGTILELELQAYGEVYKIPPKFCLEMQMKIINILLNAVYIKTDYFLQKSKVLIIKARVLRAHGFEALEDCIQCLSEAISVIPVDVFGQLITRDITVCNQLAVAYCLRALCVLEAEPNSKQVFQDIQAALDSCLNAPITGEDSLDDRRGMTSENAVLLLFHVVDFLSLKACTKFNDSIYKLIISHFKCKNISLEKLLVFLWKYRRLSHALCSLPINESIMMILSEHYGGVMNSVDYWINCMKWSEPLRVGLQLNFSMQGSSFDGCLLLDESIDEAKKAALNLISNVPVSSHSLFLASCLYRDVCGKLISNGRFIEGLSYAKDAYRLCSKLLKEKFTYELQDKMYEDGSESTQNQSFGLFNLQISSSVAIGIWSFETFSLDLESCTLTPWKVLQCYLESTLQVGIIHEVIGNESAAEVLFLSGKNISHLKGLPFFVAMFSSELGKLYRKKRLKDSSKKEFSNAEQILASDSTTISCSKCCLILEATIDQHLGDLYRCHGDCMNGSSLFRSLSLAEDLYRSALGKLNLFEWKNAVSCADKTSVETMTTVKEVKLADSSVLSCMEKKNATQLTFQEELPHTKREARKKSKKDPKSFKKDGLHGDCLVAEGNRRMTRSQYRSSQVHGADNVTQHANGAHVQAFSEIGGGGVGLEHTCICMMRKCWHCLPLEVENSGLVSDFIHLKWELIRRRISLRLLTCLGKCLGIRGEIHEMHGIFLEGMVTLLCRNAFCDASTAVSFDFLFDLIGKDIPGDLLRVERVVMIYNICWFSLKIYNSKDKRINCCFVSRIQLQRMISWLMIAFTLCREVPLLFQKVSRLLVMIILYSATSESSSLSLSSFKELSVNHWASYFHQASLGTHLNYQLFTCAPQKEVHTHIDDNGSQVAGSSLIKSETNSVLRHVPESCKDIEGFVAEFFRGLPSTTMICISMLGGAHSRLLRDLMNFPSSVNNPWVLLSRINSKRQPIVVLLPVNSILEEVSEASRVAPSCMGKDSVRRWHCPWDSTLVDDVVPVYRRIMEEVNDLTSSTFIEEDTIKNRSFWWNRRKELDQRLGTLLRNMEDSWFGPWKYLLLGEWMDCKYTDVVNRRLVHDLKCKCGFDANETVLKVILGGGHSAVEAACALELFIKNGFYIGGARRHDMDGLSSDTSVVACCLPEGAFELILEASNELGKEEHLYREPLILVLDCEVQMIPWESIPILRRQEVYRMLSIDSISATFDKYHQHLSEPMCPVSIPLIDPLDAFYLLNPSGDLRRTQAEFENWFKNHNLEGQAGSVPTTEELAEALKHYDLFMYFGHGSGLQYIPVHEIQKLEKCAAMFLMGCSSGSLSGSGCYPPRGTPIYYLRSGSPVIVGNLWDVTDKDIDRFARAMLDAWVEERSKYSENRGQCCSVVEELADLRINNDGRDSLNGVDCCVGECGHSFKHRRRIASFMADARGACMLPFLIGAAPVCYGVPTGIWNKGERQR